MYTVTASGVRPHGIGEKWFLNRRHELYGVWRHTQANLKAIANAICAEGPELCCVHEGLIDNDYQLEGCERRIMDI